MTEVVEDCATVGCEQFAEYPDEVGYQYCRDCYDGDPEFSHVPDDERRDELTESYEKHD